MTAGSGIAVLGIHQSGPVASAALAVDGTVVAAQPEERFSRTKHDRAFPGQAADYCLGSVGGWSGVDHVAIGWNAGENAALKYRGGFSDWMRYPGEWLASVPNHILTRAGWQPDLTTMRFRLRAASDTPPREPAIHFVDHHTAHARLAAASSGFSDTVVVVVDGWSEQKVTSIFHYRDGGLTLLESEAFPNSIGAFYAAMTEYLGYRPFFDEWRVMGMSAYGDRSAFPELDETIRSEPDGRYELNLRFFDFYNFDRADALSPRFVERFGPARQSGSPILQAHFDFAAAAQRVFERVMTGVLARAHRLTGSPRVCLAGGAALNCLYNATVTAVTPFSECHVSFAPDDSGNSIGAALEVASQLSGNGASGPFTSALGPSWDDEAIGEALDRYKIRARRSPSIAADVAKLLAEGRIVGWFQGRSEFGPRALGQRSILASPLDAGTKDRLNASIKYRESYRPFAPCLPLAEGDRYFLGMPAGGVPYMEKALHFRPEAGARVPACVHADGTGRVQTVDPAANPLFHQLLEAFAEHTGHPVVINTSFNLNGEPMVLDPTDAIRTFYSSGLDSLAIGGFLVEK